MAHFYTYETVEIPLTFTPAGVLEGYRHIVVSIVQDDIARVDKKDSELSIDTANDTVVVSLTQEETAKFRGGNDKQSKTAKIQVNVYYENTSRDVSIIKEISVYDNLYKKVIDYEH